jgi:hypothetical protein
MNKLSPTVTLSSDQAEAMYALWESDPADGCLFSWCIPTYGKEITSMESNVKENSIELTFTTVAALLACLS